jgi:hypothetical protein
MPKYIIKIKDKYFEWSTVVDAPTTYGMTEDELREHVQFQDGKTGLDALPERLARVAVKGTSSHMDASLAELLGCNRAGDGETELTEEQIYAKYANPPNVALTDPAAKTKETL